MKVSDLSDNWPKLIAIVALTGFLFWGWACPPRTQSLLHPGEKITRPELQIELDSIIATAEYRMADLDKQQQFQDIIFNNAILMVKTGTMNPAGIAILLASLYGTLRGGSDVYKKVKEKRRIC